jgi:hypothetical protein
MRAWLGFSLVACGTVQDPGPDPSSVDTGAPPAAPVEPGEPPLPRDTAEAEPSDAEADSDLPSDVEDSPSDTQAWTDPRGRVDTAVPAPLPVDSGRSADSAGEACPPGLIADCDGVCVPEASLGDGVCHGGAGWNLNCSLYFYDFGDCPTEAQDTSARPGDPSDTAPPCATVLQFDLRLDGWTEETTWDIRCDGARIAGDGPFSRALAHQVVHVEVPAPEASSCTLTVHDLWGDGGPSVDLGDGAFAVVGLGSAWPITPTTSCGAEDSDVAPTDPSGETGSPADSAVDDSGGLFTDTLRFDSGAFWPDLTDTGRTWGDSGTPLTSDDPGGTDVLSPSDTALATDPFWTSVRGADLGSDQP